MPVLRSAPPTVKAVVIVGDNVALRIGFAALLDASAPCKTAAALPTIWLLPLVASNCCTPPMRAMLTASAPVPDSDTPPELGITNGPVVWPKLNTLAPLTEIIVGILAPALPATSLSLTRPPQPFFSATPGIIPCH